MCSISVLSTEELSFSKLDAGLGWYMLKTNSETYLYGVCHHIKEYHGAQGMRHSCCPEEAERSKSVARNSSWAGDGKVWMVI